MNNKIQYSLQSSALFKIAIDSSIVRYKVMFKTEEILDNLDIFHSSSYAQTS